MAAGVTSDQVPRGSPGSVAPVLAEPSFGPGRSASGKADRSGTAGPMQENRTLMTDQRWTSVLQTQVKHRRERRRHAAAFTAVLLLAACGPPAATRSEPDAGISSAPPSALPAVRDSPSPAPDLTALALDRLSHAGDSIEMTFEGTLQVGGETVSVTGDYAAQGPDFEVRIVTAEPGRSTEQIVKGITSFFRRQGGDWERFDQALGGRDGVARMLAGRATFRHSDPAAPDSIETRLEASGLDLLLLARRLGLADADSTSASGEVHLVVDPAGEPLRLEVAIEVHTGAGDATLVSDWNLDYLITSLGKPVTVERPAEAWRLHSDAAGGYALLFPDTWHLLDQTDDGPDYAIILGPNEEEIQVHAYTALEGATAETFFAGSAAILERDFGITPHAEATLVGGQAGVLLSLEVDQDGELYFFQQAAHFADTFAWHINWWSLPGNEDEDRRRFEDVLARFSPLP
jgi:hypothetical protein